MAAPAVVFLAALLSVCSSIQVPGPADLRASADFDGAAVPADFLAEAGGEAGEGELATGEDGDLGGPAVLGDADLGEAAMPTEQLSGADGETRKLSVGGAVDGAGDLAMPAADVWPAAINAGAPSLGGWTLAGPPLGGQLPPGASWTRTVMEGQADRAAEVGKHIEKLSSMLTEHRQLGSELDERIALLKEAGVPAEEEGPADAAQSTPTLSPEEQHEMSKLEDEHDRVLGIYNNVHKLLGNMLYNSAKLEGSVATLYEGRDALNGHLAEYSDMVAAMA